ncbi:PREDICTED: 15-hydroxyprostaglandin dehydrogenase [NAD(+)]-like [Papilio polytes]|uniref:15-hydroxyprostaglandin dehydrogenase [NAD(+)]-like n=1 Tax=Papilio polytes TaxID=76194 RepID=UPI000676097D|nr:PREDICTED: 15-hydroxyprostaglandin dehydrogenase [NAD(+)]-like [Papilio polytes]
MAAQWNAKNKNILITGAASGLGAAYAQALLRDGAQNIAVLDIDEKTGQNFVAKLNETYNNKAIFIRCDVSKEADIDNSFKTVLNQFQRIDVLINNAGIMSDTDSLWRLASDVNWQGLVSFTMKAVKHMRKDEGGAGGTIVNISSTAGICKLNFLPIYCGSKGAVLHFSQSLASAPFYDNTGIRVLTLCPGPTATKLMEGMDQRIVETTTMKQLQLDGVIIQRIESAVAAMMKLLKDGDNGSIWLSANDKPALELTPQINKYLNELEKLTLP